MFIENKRRIKVILLGDSGVGKTSMIQRYNENIFDETIKITYNASYLEKELEIKNEKVILELWDTAGQEEYRSLTQLFIKNAKIMVLVYNVTSLKSFENLNYWYNFIKKNIGPSTILGLAGNKTDLIFDEDFEEEVSPQKGREFAEQIGATFSLVSAKESANEIIALFNILVEKYLEIRDFDLDSVSTIKLDTPSQIDNSEGCCLGKGKKEPILKMIFLGYKGVGKTSIIKAIKGNTEINNLPHTKSSNIEKLHYNKHGQGIVVELKDTNWNEYNKEELEQDMKNYKIFFLVFDIHKKETLYALRDLIKKLHSNKNRIYLLGYNNTKSFYNSDNGDFDFTQSAESIAKNYECVYEYVTIKDISKVKDIIVEQIRIYLGDI